ncbi:unnamed protein product [Ambrosiozyma monospora]|uniref:Unnamed protein product n=1 Tax=Ambrosiozyma monospora TaxID=43982 RepID=A0A9W6Z703_AMBMO|nr:unnamed protein product [Ambrosiozyma monospora]
MLVFTTVRSTGFGEGLYLTSSVANSHFGSSFKVGNFLNGHKPAIAIGAPYDDITGSVYVLPLDEVLENHESKKGVFSALKSSKYSPNTTSNLQILEDEDDDGYHSKSTSLNFPIRFGYSKDSLNLAGAEFLVVSEPGTSQLKLFYSGKLVAVISHNKATAGLGDSGIKELGMVLKTIKPSSEGGYDNLFIGSSYSDNYLSRSQSGYGLLLSGEKLFHKIVESQVLEMESNDDVIGLDAMDLQLASFEVPASHKLVNAYEQVGTSVETLGDLLFLGTGKVGEVLVFSKYTGSFITSIAAPNPDPKLESNNFVEELILINQKSRPRDSEDSDFYSASKKLKNWSLFGFHSIVSGTSSSKNWVLISAAYESTPLCSLCGAVYLYEFENLPTGHCQEHQQSKPKFNLVSKIIPTIASQSDTCNFGVQMTKTNTNSSQVLISGDGCLDGRGLIPQVPIL